MIAASRTSIALLTGLTLGFGGALTGSVLADRPREEPRSNAAESLPWQDAKLLAEVLERIKREYVDPIDDHALMESAVRGMVGALDPHSAFLDTEEYDEVRFSTTGNYPGVGIEVAATHDGIKVLRPFEDSPAERAGIRSGDLILRIDDEAVGSDLEAAIERMRGPAGSIVRLSLKREGAPELIELAITRSQVEVKSVSHATLEPGFGYLRITNFNETTPADVDRAMSQIARANRDGLRGLVLDLRNNPGGVLEAAIEVSDAFLERGVIVSADGRTPDARFRIEAKPGDVAQGAPIVVLINGGSASAAEIVAGALHDHRRAQLIGRQTYGKGSVQTLIPLADGRALKLTTSRYFTPSGASIQNQGIAPDVAAPGEEHPPIELAALAGAQRLQERDADVKLALEALKSQQRVAHAALD